jgi:glycerophosphoryl diester phosphodiesterase
MRALLAVVGLLVVVPAAGAATNPWIEKTPLDIAHQGGEDEFPSKLGAQTLQITTKDNVARAHREGYAWHTWLSDDGESPAIWTSLLDMGVDGVMTAKPKAFAALLRTRGQGHQLHGKPPTR